MTDLSELLSQIQRPEKSHVDMIKRRAKGTLQWFLEKDQATHPVHDNNRLEFFMCGQEGFAAIEQDIRQATSCIDMVLWGFDPGMELTRTGNTWPHGMTYGELLVRKAREGVKVRLLVWWGGHAVGNLPDFPWFWSPAPFSSKTKVTWPDSPLTSNARTNSAGVLQDRHNFCIQWWKDALSGAFENLEIRFRTGHPLKVMQNLKAYLPDSSRSLMEEISLLGIPTHHQKPVLIDYVPAPGKTPNTCGYVMGLNSVTDYWDTTGHKFNDQRRELSPNAYTGGSETRWHRKPYRDYAIRVRGEALYNLNENFVQGWDSADGVPPFNVNAGGLFKHKLTGERAHIKAESLKASAQGGRCRVQILRTQPEKNDGTILKAYTLASANALSFIYVENQYFQLSEWAKLLKDMRAKYRKAMKDAGAAPSAIAPVHLFVVTPQPERAQMVPRTYEAVGLLGAGGQMQAYNSAVQGQRKVQEAQEAIPDWARPVDQLIGPDVNQDSMTSQSAQTVPVDAGAQLETLGIKVLVAMLMTYDAGNQAKNIRIKARDSDAQQAQAAKERKANKTTQRAADEIDNRSDYSIVPKRYREIYIHSKLMIVDDVYLTLGSANLNARSMAADSELNLCTEEYAFTREARKRVWGNLAGEDLNGGNCTREETKLTHENWLKRMKNNATARTLGKPPEKDSFIHPLEDPRGVPWIKLA
jgi:phosphatidylserine/phosphatidylglycerophosphate/cardiolipin synthase-like enzyme